jgi:uncharacterized repeat protein (TIGR03803 family)
LSKGSNGKWSEKTIHNFPVSEGPPNGDLAVDNAGNVYGTTPIGGSSSLGEFFELSPQTNGGWQETILFSFSPSFLVEPVAGPTFDNKGNVYGTGRGGTNGFGGVYELSPQSNGQWTGTALYLFQNKGDGWSPNSKITLDASGNLYGTTDQGDNIFGTVFQLSQSSGGTWKETTLHAFKNGGIDGLVSRGALVFDTVGNLYGTTYNGGTGCNAAACGTAYRLTPQSNGPWKETIIHQFESADDGSQPQGGVFFDGSAHLYGTTQYGGGRYGYGTVFEISK